MILLGSCSTYLFIPLRTIPSAPITNGMTMVFVFRILPISISRSLYFESFSAAFAVTFLSDDTAISIRMHCFFYFPLTMISGVFALISLSVWMGISHSIVTPLPLVFVFGL